MNYIIYTMIIHYLQKNLKFVRLSKIVKNCFDIANKYGIKIGGVNKLVSNLGNKKNMLFTTEIFSHICH